MMKTGLNTSQAVVLSRINYGEADLIVHFFSLEFGKQSGIAKHGRKSRKRFGNVLSPASLVNLEFKNKPGRELLVLEKGEVIRAFDGLGRDVNLLAHGSQALELTEAFCQADDSAPEVFHLLTWCLDRFEKGSRPLEYSLLFMVKLLIISGFGPNLTSCGLCGREAAAGRLMAEHGGLVCDSCSTVGFPISPGGIKTLGLMQNMPLEKTERIRMAERDLADCLPFFYAYVRHILGRELKSARFLAKLTAKIER